MRARILIVDDDQAYLAGMKELLEDAGYEVFLAGSFEEGKHVLRDRAPHLLIVDVRLDDERTFPGEHDEIVDVV